MSTMSESEIKEEFLSVVRAESTHVAEHTIKKWKLVINRVKGKYAIMKVVTNLYLAGCNLSSTL